MFERFTDRARRVVVLSQEEARRLHHNYIGTEHILLALLREKEGIAGRVLTGFGMSLDGVRLEVVAMVGEGQHEGPQRIPFTPRAKKVLELALREALQLKHNYIGTEHILLGLIREGDGVAAKILREHGDPSAMRAEIIELVPAWTGAQAALARVQFRRRDGQPAGPGEFAVEFEPVATPATDTTLAEAARLAGAQPVGSHHLLLAALADPASAAAKALISLGVDLDQAKDALRGVDITGTSDEPPEEAGRRQLNIQVTDELVTVVAADPVIVEAGQGALRTLALRDEGGQTAAPGSVIRGADLHGAAAASLATAWQALRDTLTAITATTVTVTPASLIATDTVATDTAATTMAATAAEQDDPDQPGTGTA
jgi:ATP-dependent Clp protease ATP-binding subunit ClpA